MNNINKDITIFTDFEIEISPKILNYYTFSPISSLKEQYKKELELFEKYPEKDYNNKNKRDEFINKIKDLPIEIFINISINKLITKIGLEYFYSPNKDGVEEDKTNSNFFEFIKYVIGSNKMPKKMSKLLTMIYDKDLFNKNLIKKVNDEEGFFISLYGLRYCLKSLKNEKEKKNFYTSLLHEKKYELPEDMRQIPGCFPIFPEMINFLINKIILAKKSIKKLSKEYREIYFDKYKNILEIRFLVLNFILASYLFFSDCLGKLDDKKRDILPKEESLIKIMKHDFKDLSVRLKLESINSVEIFMDLIYEDLSELIIKSNSFSDKEETLDFEIKVDEIILKAIDEYNDYKVKYIKENYDFLEKEEKENNRNYLLIKELIPIEELNDNEKLFMFTKFHKEEEKKKQLF